MTMQAVITALAQQGVPSKRASWLAEKARRELFAAVSFHPGSTVIWCTGTSFTLGVLT